MDQQARGLRENWPDTEKHMKEGSGESEADAENRMKEGPGESEADAERRIADNFIEEVHDAQEVPAGESGLREFLEMVCVLYMTALLLILPLYMKEGYWQIGDAKYVLFRNVSILCLFLGGVTGGIIFLQEAGWRGIFRAFRSDRERKGSGLLPAGAFSRRAFCWSWMDTFVAAYGVANILSFLMSEYRKTAWEGYEQWHMGLLAQLLFVGTYFFVSRRYKGRAFPLACGQAALLVTSVIGIANRCETDPLKLFGDMGPENWDFTHLLSTLGNINWLCGYVSVALPFAAIGYLRAKSLWRGILLYPVTLSGMVLLTVQGSDSGLAILFAALLLLLVAACFYDGFLDRILLLGLGLAVTLPLLASLIERRYAWDTFPTDDKGHLLLRWQGWWLVALLLAVFLALSRFFSKKGRKRLAAGSLFLLAGAGCWLAAGYLGTGDFARSPGQAVNTELSTDILAEGEAPGLGLPAGWASGRGGLWNLAWDGFVRGDGRQKLVGSGPDCFAEYVYRSLPVESYLDIKGHWQESVFTNAHNEWLTQLVNTGVCGLICFGGIFAAAALRYGRRSKTDSYFLLGLGVACLYGINSLVSFQQVLSAPVFFLAMGVCESRSRKGLPDCREDGKRATDKV